MFEKIVNVETGEVIEREITGEELEKKQAEEIALNSERELLEQAAAEAEAKRSAALAKLEVLGLDEDDLKALGL